MRAGGRPPGLTNDAKTSSINDTQEHLRRVTEAQRQEEHEHSEIKINNNSQIMTY